MNDFQSIGGWTPSAVRSHRNQQKLVKHSCFDIKMPKPLILPAFPAFFIKNQRNSCILQAFPAFLSKTKEKDVYYKLFQLFE